MYWFPALNRNIHSAVHLKPLWRYCGSYWTEFPRSLWKHHGCRPFLLFLHPVFFAVRIGPGPHGVTGDTSQLLLSVPHMPAKHSASADMLNQDSINLSEAQNSVQRADKALINLEQKVCMLTSRLKWDLWDTGTTSPYKYLLLDPDSVVITAKYWPAAAAPPSIIHCEERLVLFNMRNRITLKYWTSFYHNFKPTLNAWIWTLYAFWQSFHLSTTTFLWSWHILIIKQTLKMTINGPVFESIFAVYYCNSQTGYCHCWECLRVVLMQLSCLSVICLFCVRAIRADGSVTGLGVLFKCKDSASMSAKRQLGQKTAATSRLGAHLIACREACAAPTDGWGGGRGRANRQCRIRALYSELLIRTNKSDAQSHLSSFPL